MSVTNKEYCYNYFDCKEMDCIRRKYLTTDCWDIDDVGCQSHSPSFEHIKQQVGCKLEACKLCIFYQKHHDM